MFIAYRFEMMWNIMNFWYRYLVRANTQDRNYYIKYLLVSIVVFSSAGLMVLVEASAVVGSAELWSAVGETGLLGSTFLVDFTIGTVFSMVVLFI